MITVDLVNMDKRFVVLSTGAILPIVNFRDDEGDDCGPEDAAFVFARVDSCRCLVIEMEVFEGETIH